MKILVTGGAGYIGSHTILEILRSTDWEVISVDNYLRSTPKTFDRIRSITGKSILNYEVDLTDLAATERVFKENADLQGIIHFAALKSVKESVADPVLYEKTNMGALQSVLSCMKKFSIPNLIFSSSCTVYGTINQLPVNESTPIGKAESPYGKTKQDGESFIEKFIKGNPDFNAISLRYFNPAGAHESAKIGEVSYGTPVYLVPVITASALNHSTIQVFGTDYPTRDGTCIRDYIHIEDIAEAHVQALKYLFSSASRSIYEIINLGSGDGLTVLEMIKAFEKVTGIKIAYQNSPKRPGDIPAIYSDSSKAKKLLGWSPKRNVEDIMRTAWKWEQELRAGA